VIDASPELTQASYQLRYQVYCVEREFLPAAAYPSRLEVDEFEQDSIHVGAVDGRGRLAGTARLVLPVQDVLPTMQHCAFAPIARPLWGPSRRWVEASRLSVSRAYRAPDSDDAAKADQRGPIFLTILRALYIGSKQVGATHWLVSIERSLQRLLARHGFPFRQLGPEFDFLGPVAPYSLDLRELEQVVQSQRFPQLAEFTAAVLKFGVDVPPSITLPFADTGRMSAEMPVGR
jgi:N-acyl amino acid synthase of PEP-CTERM/exosortase system